MASPRSPANTPRPRTRNGCWTCRKRRRKCDERKPRCQNCIDKNRQCQYGVQLTFLDVNMQTLLTHDSDDLERNAPGKYSNLQFVDGFEEALDYSETVQHMAERLENFTTPSNSSQLQNLAVNLDDRTSSLSVVPDPLDSDVTFQADVRSLITPRITPSSRMSGISRFEGFPLSGRNRPPSQSPMSFEIGATNPLATIRKPNDLCLEEAMNNTVLTKNLLKAFIDKVIPWLDMYCAGSPHSAYLPIIGSQSPPLRLVILALATYQLPHPMDPELSSQLRTRANEQLKLEDNNTEMGSCLARELLVIAHLLSEPIHAWRSTMANRLAAMDTSMQRRCNLPENFTRISWWALLRFDLGTSIISHQPPLTSVEAWEKVDTSYSRSSSSPPSCGDPPITYHDRTLLLCINVVKFRYSQDPSSYDQEATWTHLHTHHQSLTASHSSQSESQSLLTSSIGRISLSTTTTVTSPTPLSFLFQLHTTRLSFHTTLLTHLTCLFLLQCIPPRLKLQLKLTQTVVFQSLKTETWHAVQICSLALSNRLIWSCDPVVVAALLLAGRMLSYEQQQSELMGFLRRLRGFTGWVFDGEIRELEEVWEEGYL